MSCTPDPPASSSEAHILPIVESPAESSEQGNMEQGNMERAVRLRYADAARAVEPQLCCPVDYTGIDLSFIPAEIQQRDYGCGNPAPFVKPGDTVLDLGAGGGKICYATAKLVGPQGRVIGVDCNAEMLALARKYQDAIAQKLGYANVDFRYGLIQDLRLDLEKLESRWGEAIFKSPEDWLKLRGLEQELRDTEPMVEDKSVDCVVSNCVLNLVRHEDRHALFSEIFRVLRPGGRAAISDIVSDEDIPAEMQRDPQLWSGCLSGAFREDRFVQAFVDAGFVGVRIEVLQREPWQEVEGIEFRSMTLLATKPFSGPCLEAHQAVIYRGPFAEVCDDEGHCFQRGVRTAVCDRTFRFLATSEWADQFLFIEPTEPVELGNARPFHCDEETRVRDPRETKGAKLATGMATLRTPKPCC